MSSVVGRPMSSEQGETLVVACGVVQYWNIGVEKQTETVPVACQNGAWPALSALLRVRTNCSVGNDLTRNTVPGEYFT